MSKRLPQTGDGGRKGAMDTVRGNGDLGGGAIEQYRKFKESYAVQKYCFKTGL